MATDTTASTMTRQKQRMKNIKERLVYWGPCGLCAAGIVITVSLHATFLEVMGQTQAWQTTPVYFIGIWHAAFAVPAAICATLYVALMLNRIADTDYEYQRWALATATYAFVVVTVGWPVGVFAGVL